MLENAIKNVVRGWKKSLLFWLLIVLIALFFICGAVLAVGMQQYSDKTYASYRSIGLFEYVGGAYPDETVYSEDVERAARQLESLRLFDDPRVGQWDAPQNAVAYTDKIVRIDQEVPYYENAVLLLKTDSSQGDPWYYYVTVEKAFYTVRKTEGRRIRFDARTIPLEWNHYYLVSGYYQTAGSAVPIFTVHSYRNATAEASGFDGGVERMILDVTAPDGGYAIPKDCPLLSIAETYRVQNDGLRLTYTSDVESLLPFEQEQLYLVDGRFFTPQEYERGDKVCILTEWIADRLRIGVGDSVSFSVVSDPRRSFAECYWPEKGFDAQETYTVVGVTNASEEHLHAVFVPKDANAPQQGNFTYTLGIARLDNDGAEAFYADVAPTLPENVRLQIYDQGWSTVSGPLRSVRTTVTWLSAFSGVAMLVLAVVFGFLFVYSDRKTAQIMTRLGTNVPKVYGHYLIGAGLLALTAAAVSVVLSFVFLPKIISAMDRALTSTVTDHTLDYSNAALSFARPLEPLNPPAFELLLLAGALVVLLSVTSCTLFAYAAMKKPMQRREAVIRRSHRGGSASLTGGAFQYAVLAAVRGGARSIAPFVVVLLCAILLLGLCAGRQSYVEQLASIREHTKIKGVYTDLSGRRTDNLLIEAHLINALYRTGLVEDLSVSGRLYSAYVGHIVTNGDTDEIEQNTEAVTPALLEKYADLFSADKLVFTDNMLRHPIFGTAAPAVRWLDGYDESIFASDEIETVTHMVPASSSAPPPKGAEPADFSGLVEQTEVQAPLVVPERFLSDRSIEVGDVAALQLYRPDGTFVIVRFRIVGSYNGSTEVNHLFCPLEYFLPHDLLYADDDSVTERLYPFTFENAQFTLKNSDDLPALKAFFLESGYSEVRQIRLYRTFVVLNDSSFLYTTAQLEKRIAALPSFCPIAVGVGIAIAFILVFLRKKEAVTMKLLGTRRSRAWLSLWLEQVLLCAAGVWLALSGFLLVKRALPPDGLKWLLLLSAGYLSGAGLCAALICFTKLSSRSREV